MANILKNALNRFASKIDGEMETATARRAELSEQIAAQEKLIQEVSLQAVKGGMSDEDVEAYRANNGKLAELRGLFEACDRWIGELHEAERQRKHEADIKISKSRVNSYTQQVRKLDRLEAEQEKNIKSLISNWVDRQELCKTIEKLIPYNDFLNNNAFRRFTTNGLRQAEAKELVRQGIFGQGLSDHRGPASYPAAEELRTYALGAYGYETPVGDLPGMAGEGKTASDWSIREFGQLLGLAPDGTATASYKAPVAPKAIPATPTGTRTRNRSHSAFPRMALGTNTGRCQVATGSRP
jgi:hypothetical protein